MTLRAIFYERIGEIIYALFENGNIIEVRIEDKTKLYGLKIGQQYCGRVKEIDMRLSGAFIDIGIADVFLKFNGARPKYLIEGKAILVEITRVKIAEKSAIAHYIGDARQTSICPRLIEDCANIIADWPNPFAANAQEQNLIEILLENITSPTIGLHGGGSICIEQTKAMCTIDVDAGGRAAGGTNQDNFNHKLNLEAAKTICSQLILRNIGGPIVIDFVGAPKQGQAREIFETMKSGLCNNLKCEILPLSKFGLCEIVRQKKGDGLHEIMQNQTARIAIDAINALAKELKIAKGKVVKLRICTSALQVLESWQFDWQSYLRDSVGGNYEISQDSIERFEIT